MTSARILVVDDDEAARRALERFLTASDFHVVTVGSANEALERLPTYSPDIILTDLVMPEMSGEDLLARIRKTDRDLPVIVMTGSDDVSRAVAAMRAGATEFLTKPIDTDLLHVTIERAMFRRSLRTESEALKRKLRDRGGDGLHGLIGSSPAMQRVYATARQVASSRATVLITGESGTGKGELARAIHAIGSRSTQPFVSFHCASVPETLLETELFGHEKGAFTSADAQRIGRFEQANGGTIFLDEIGEISPLMQVKLLRVLQDRVIERIGSNESIPVDVRVLAATNRDLGAEVRQKRFREDLFYRLNVITIDLPPLRLRGGDVLALADHFRERFARDNHKQVKGFTDPARAKLVAHRWPGNVRELENAVERAVVLADGELVDADDIPISPAQTKSALRIPGSTMAEIERHAILSTLAEVDGSTSRAAEVLGISVRTIQYRLASYGMDDRKPRARPPSATGRVA